MPWQRRSVLLGGAAALGGLTFAPRTAQAAAVAEAATSLKRSLERWRAATGTPGAALGWLGADGTRDTAADGSRAAGRRGRVRPGDRWHLGSLTKSMTATLVAMAVEAGLIGWDTRVGDTLGALMPDLHSGYHDVTMLHLLAHASGLARDIPMEDFAQFSKRALADARAERLAYAAAGLRVAPTSAPGTATLYSNTGYVVAAAMLEQRAGSSWEVLLDQRLFRPLGLTSAGYGPPGPGQPSGHIILASGKRVPSGDDNPVAMGPAGRVHMNLADLLTYLAAHRDATPALLNREGWAQLHTPPFGGETGLGWVVGPNGYLSHNGSNTQWYADVSVDPAAGVVAAFACNDSAVLTGASPSLLRAAERAALFL